MKILITGANGLLGSHTVNSLRNAHEVHALVRHIPDSPISGVSYHQIDFSKPWEFGKLPASIDTIIHLAQSDNFRNFPDKALDIFQVNIESTARLLEYARHAKATQFIYASSGGVYGCGNTAFDENSPLGSHGQLGYYLGSKLCSEILVHNYTSLMNVTIMRFFFMYGPGQKRSMLIPRLIDSVKAGRAISLQSDEGIRINPVHVLDSTEALNSSLKLEGSYTLNIAGPEVLSLRQIATAIGNRLGIQPIFEFNDEPPKHLIANIDAMKSMLHSPTICLANGIDELLHA